MLLDKKFHGDLEASSKGQMLAHMTSVKGSAGYVAMEKVIGNLQGRKGSFVLQHSGTMNRGEATLVLTVVPDSGTGALVGLTGKMDIIIEGKEHKYVFEYSMTKEEPREVGALQRARGWPRRFGRRRRSRQSGRQVPS